MASKALLGLQAGLVEIQALQKANPSPQQGGGLTKPDVVRALGRSEVVLLSSHFERYVYAVTEEAVAILVAQGVAAGALSEQIRLQYSRATIDDIAATHWERRAEQLREYTATGAALWDELLPIGDLDPERLLTWMKSPKCKDLVRAFRLWGIEDIFNAITRKSAIRQDLWLRLSELVDKRNGIAHGDLTVEARYLDIVQYKSAVRTFCTRADHSMSKAVARMAGGPPPW